MIVDGFDERSQVLARLSQIAVDGAVDLLGLEGFHEALGLGVVVGVGDPAHAWRDAMPGQPLGVLGAGILGGFKRSSQHPLSASLYGWL